MSQVQMMERNFRASDLMFAVMRLGRALRRCPPEQGERPFPPAVGRLLSCVHENPGISSRELCDVLDLRPSTLSEILGKADSDGWLTRVADEGDKRMQHITLTEQGEQIISGMEAAREADAEKKASCFTEEERIQFTALCNRFCDHLEKMGADKPDSGDGPEPRDRGPHGDPRDEEGEEGPGPRGRGLHKKRPRPEEEGPGPRRRGPHGHPRNEEEESEFEGREDAPRGPLPMRKHPGARRRLPFLPGIRIRC